MVTHFAPFCERRQRGEKTVRTRGRETRINGVFHLEEKKSGLSQDTVPVLPRGRNKKWSSTSEEERIK